MKSIEKLPSAFKHYPNMMGVLNFAIFENASGTEEETFSAIPEALLHSRKFDAERLRGLGFRRITERDFYGDWYDLETGHLLKVGSWTTADGRQLENPKLKDLDEVKIMFGAATRPEAGTGGQFAYAFSRPPYGLKGRPSEVQAVFDAIRDFILPPGMHSEICDWSNPRLPEVSDYFAAGMEWWGVFLFSIYTPEIRRLSIVAGSTTD